MITTAVAAEVLMTATAFAAGPVIAVVQQETRRRRRAFERALAITPGRALAVSHRAAPGRPPTFPRWRHRRPRTLPWPAWRLPLLPARRALTLVGAR
jgi:hypothetical protein